MSPHGHTDPRWFAENAAFSDASALFITPDHYVFRMLYSQGVSLESLCLLYTSDAADERSSVDLGGRRIIKNKQKKKKKMQITL